MIQLSCMHDDRPSVDVLRRTLLPTTGHYFSTSGALAVAVRENGNPLVKGCA